MKHSLIVLLSISLSPALLENQSPIFSSKKKSSGDAGAMGLGASNFAQDIVEHDVGSLSQMSQLPAPDSLEAVRLSGER